MRRALLLLALLPLPAMAQDDHLVEADGIRVLHAWTNAGEGNTAEVYMEIENAGNAASNLAEVSFEGARLATFVAPPLDATGVVPETLDGILLPPGIETVLEPDGLHILLHDVEAPREEGDELEVMLRFEPQGEVAVPVEVEAEDATRHSDAD